MEPVVYESLLFGISSGESLVDGIHADFVGGAPLSIFTFGQPFVDGLGLKLLGSVDAIGGELLADLVGSAFLSSEHEVGGDGVPVFLGTSSNGSVGFSHFSFDFIHEV